jgi:general nucleoside transport system permease protein
MDIAVIMVVLVTTIRSTTPLLFAALGGMYSERSGVVNIALEGIMLFGALTAAIVAQQLEAPLVAANPGVAIWWTAWAGVFAAMVMGAFIGWIHAVVSIKYKADQVISGTAINLLALGMPAVVLQFLYNNTSDSEKVLNSLPLWGLEGFAFSPLTFLSFLLVPITAYVIYRTPFGLRLRAVGEAPQAAASVGVNVFRTRYAAVMISGVLAALAGAFLSIGNLDGFNRGMSAGQGFIALAALIFGRYQPWQVMGACLLFGFFRALAIRLGGDNILPSALVDNLPFIITMFVLAGFIGKSRSPKALGRPYP